jgi:hypothetical protein
MITAQTTLRIIPSLSKIAFSLIEVSEREDDFMAHLNAFIAWNNNRGDLIAFMDGQRARIIYQERRTVLVARSVQAVAYLKVLKDEWLSRSFPATDAGIICNMNVSPATWLQLPPIREIIELPGDELIGFDKWWDGPLDDTRSLLETINLDMHSQLASKLPRSPLKEASDLTRATCVFHCTSCELPVFYPDVLFHPCMAIAESSWEDDDDLENYLELTEYGHGYNRCAWNTRTLVADERLEAVVRQVIEAFGLDPETASAQDMDALESYAYYHDMPITPSTGHSPFDIMALFPWMKLHAYHTRLGRSIPAVEDRDLDRPRKYLFGWRKLVRHIFLSFHI